jgi:sterol 3beta-glucosyltransferase
MASNVFDHPLQELEGEDNGVKSEKASLLETSGSVDTTPEDSGHRSSDGHRG